MPSLVFQTRLDRAWATGSEPPASWHEAVIDAREDLLLHLIEKLAWTSLVCISRRGRHATILELTEHQLSVANKDRASCISIVNGALILQAQPLQDVVHNDGGL